MSLSHEQREALYGALVEAAPDGMLVADRDGTIVLVNAEVEAIFGYARAELIGQKVDMLVPERFQPLHVAQREAYAAAPRTRTMGTGRPLFGRRRDGTEVPVALSLSTVDAPGGPLLVAAIRDVNVQLENVTERRRAERAFEALVEQAADAVLIADLEGRFIGVNSAGCKMLGYSREELQAMTVADVLARAELSRLATTKERVLAGGVDVAEWMFKRKDGVLVPVEASTKVLDDHRWLAFVRDITERRRAEAALRRSEDGLATAQRVAHLGSWDWDLETNEVVRSAELFSIFGLEPSERYKQRGAMWHLVHPDDRQLVADLVDGAAAAGQPYTVEHRIVRSDGTERDVAQQGEPIFEEGRLVRFVGTVLDITERKRAEREREAALRRLATVLDECPVGIAIFQGPHGEQVENNRRARELLGDSIQNQSLRVRAESVLRSDGTPFPFDELAPSRALRGERVHGIEALKRRDGKPPIPLSVNAAPLLDPKGAVQGAVVTFEDMSAVKELERLRSEWNAVVAHDLRQPVSVIHMRAELLASSDEVSAKGREALGHILRNTRRLHRMVGDLMDFARIETGRIALSRDPVDLTTHVRLCVEEASIAHADQKFEVSLPDAVPAVRADPDRIDQILENLLVNAVKYGERSAPIKVRIEAAPNEVAVSVTNRGRGIAADELPHVFERFHRSRVTVGKGIAGIGLGLYIVRELVEGFGGRVSAESTPGEETTFRVTLPVIAARAGA